MFRRKFLASAVALGALTPLGIAKNANAAAAKSAGKDAAASAKTLLSGTPAVFAPAADGFSVVSVLSAAALVSVQYCEAAPDAQIPSDAAAIAKLLTQTAASDGFGFVPHDDNVVQIQVKGLKPNTKYFWRFVAKPLSGANKIPQFSKVYSTRTLAPASAETQFFVWNDTHDRAATVCALHDRCRLAAFAGKTTPDFLLWNGDLCNNVNSRNQLPHLFVSPKNADLAELPPIFVARGNHDVRGIWSNKVPDYVAFPNKRPYYAFRSGPVAAIVLDTGEDKPDSHPSFGGVAAFEPLIREQTAWLSEIIQNPDFRDAPYRVVFCHIPLLWIDEAKSYKRNGYDWYSGRGREAWTPALKRWGAQVVISGHTHHAVKIPATAQYPFEQIIGGGPAITGNVKGATLLRAHANKTRLRLDLFALTSAPSADTPLFHSEFPALA